MSFSDGVDPPTRSPIRSGRSGDRSSIRSGRSHDPAAASADLPDRIEELAAASADLPDRIGDRIGGRGYGAGVASARAATAERIIGLIDLTDLADDRAVDGIDALVADALEHGCAAVCVWPEHVARCVARRREAGAGPDRLAIATVVDFPLGEGEPEEVLDEARRALAGGADELDLVLARTSLRFDDDGSITDGEHARSMVRAVAEVAHGAGAHLKVILETGELGTAGAIRSAALLAIEEGADVVKTSTGKVGTGATPEAVAAVLDAIEATGATTGIKPSGGIRTVDEAAALLALADERFGPGWARPATFRFGASGLLAAALAERHDR